MKIYASLVICMGLLLSSNNSYAMESQSYMQRIQEAEARKDLSALQKLRAEIFAIKPTPAFGLKSIGTLKTAVDAAISRVSAQPAQPQAKQNINTAPGYDVLGQGAGGKNEAQLKTMKAALQGLLTLDPNVYNIPPNFAVQVQNKIRDVDTAIAALAGPPPPPADAEGAVRDVMDQIQKTAAQIRQTYQPIQNQLRPETRQKMQQTVNSVAAITQ